eukprot:g2759.t1
MFAYSEGIAAVRASPSAASLREAYREAKASYAQNPSEEHHQAWKTAKNSYKQRKKLDELDRAATKIQAHHRRITGFRYAQARLAQQRDDIWNEIRGDAVVQIQSAFRGWNYRRMHSNRVNEMAMASALADTDVPSDHDAIDRNSGKNSPDAVDEEGDGSLMAVVQDLDTNEVQSVEEEADVTEEVRTGKRSTGKRSDVIKMQLANPVDARRRLDTANKACMKSVGVRIHRVEDSFREEENEERWDEEVIPEEDDSDEDNLNGAPIPNIETLGQELEEDLIMQAERNRHEKETGDENMDSHSANLVTDELLLFSDPDLHGITQKCKDSAPSVLRHKDYLISKNAFERRIMLFNKQATDAMREGSFAVAERIFMVCSQLLADNASDSEKMAAASFENVSKSKLAELRISTYNNLACLERKLKRYDRASKYLTLALQHSTCIARMEKRAVAVLPVMTNCAAVASVRGALLGPDGGMPNKDRKRKIEDEPDPPNRMTEEDLLSSQSVIQSAVESIRTKIQADRCSLFLLDPGDGMLVCLEAAPDPVTGKGGHPEFRIPKSAGLVGYVMSTGGILNLPDAYHYKLFNPAIDKASGYRTKAVIAIPILGSSGVLGVVEFINKLGYVEKDNGEDDHHEKPSFFTLEDMRTVREGIGVVCEKIRPLPVSVTSTSLCPKKLRRKYIDNFTPGLHLLIDTTQKR